MKTYTRSNILLALVRVPVLVLYLNEGTIERLQVLYYKYKYNVLVVTFSIISSGACNPPPVKVRAQKTSMHEDNTDL